MTFKDTVHILTVDIGEKNLCLWIDKYNLSDLRELSKHNIHKKLRYDMNGEYTADFSILMNKLYKIGSRVFMDKKDLTDSSDKKWGKKRIISSKFTSRLFNYLEDLNTLNTFDNVDYFAVEKQRKEAANNIEIEHYVKAYFVMLFLSFKKILSIHAAIKTTLLGMPKKVKDIRLIDSDGLTISNKLIKLTGSKAKTRRKQWTSNLALGILNDRGDSDAISRGFVSKNKKKMKTDDYSDTLTLNIAFVYNVFIDNDAMELIE